MISIEISFYWRLITIQLLYFLKYFNIITMDSIDVIGYIYGQLMSFLVTVFRSATFCKQVSGIFLAFLLREPIPNKNLTCILFEVFR